MFLRGHPQLCQLVKHRFKCCRLLPNLVCEPDLYKIAMEYPLPAAVTAESNATGQDFDDRKPLAAAGQAQSLAESHEAPSQSTKVSNIGEDSVHNKGSASFSDSTEETESRF